ncbi:AAA-ATPase-like domain-containing protein [Candidatus Electrothrix aarhusensis]
MLNPLPTSIQTFCDLINGGYLYIDKTKYLYELVRYPKGVYFLARPRRFGKSLLISTLDEIFQGNKELFKGLWLYDSPYQWQQHPVIRIDFSRHRIRNEADLEVRIHRHLSLIARQYNIDLPDAPFDIQFEELILSLGAEKQVVILIDEYDKPLIDNLERREDAQAIQQVMREFYTVIKSMDQYIRFVFITGVSRFSRVGVFSSMNNLLDLTMHSDFAGLLGLTEEEIRHSFQGYLTKFAKEKNILEDALLDKMRRWYDGFRFVEGSERLYNPFSTMHFFHNRRFANYWFETGTPSFLIKLIKEQNFDVTQLEQLELRETAFSTYDLENLAVTPLLVQTGYLTIKDYDQETRKYTLAYPNYEVEDAFSVHLLGAFSSVEYGLGESYLWKLIDALQAGELEEFFTILDVFFANIDYQLHLKYEKYYQTIFYLIFLLLGLRVEAEVETNKGRIDAVVELKKAIFLFEFKLDGSADEALRQIITREYYQKYSLKGKPVTLVGVNFDSRKRGVAEWRSEIVHSSTGV